MKPLKRTNWKLQCLVCTKSRKKTDEPYITCSEYGEDLKIVYGSDVFTGFLKCDTFDPMPDPFKKEAMS